MSKSKILVVGGTWYIGKRIVKASLAQGHPTFVLMRREIGYEVEKLQTLLSFKQQGARLVEGSFSDHQSLVNAVKEVDVVICTTLQGFMPMPTTFSTTMPTTCRRDRSRRYRHTNADDKWSAKGRRE